MSTPVWQGPSLLHGFWTFSSVHYFWKCELHILRVCTAKVLNTIHTHQNPWLSHELSLHFHQSPVHFHNGWLLWAQGRSATAHEGCMTLRLEHLHFRKNKWAFGQLLTSFEFIAKQDTCYYSGLSFLLSICVGTQGQEITFLFFTLCLFVSSHCSYLSQSVSEVCQSVVSPASLSFLNLIGMAFILFCSVSLLYLDSNHW